MTEQSSRRVNRRVGWSFGEDAVVAAPLAVVATMVLTDIRLGLGVVSGATDADAEGEDDEDDKESVSAILRLLIYTVL